MTEAMLDVQWGVNTLLLVTVQYKYSSHMTDRGIRPSRCGHPEKAFRSCSVGSQFSEVVKNATLKFPANREPASSGVIPKVLSRSTAFFAANLSHLPVLTVELPD